MKEVKLVTTLKYCFCSIAPRGTKNSEQEAHVEPQTPMEKVVHEAK
jgi:hypothetical protein